jgi:hypothetical protein
VNGESYDQDGRASQEIRDSVCRASEAEFLAGVKRRTGEDREIMLAVMASWESRRPEPWPSDGTAPHVVRWLRLILGAGQ